MLLLLLMLLLLKLLTLHAVAGQRVFGMGSAALCPTQLFLRCPRHGSRPASHSSLTVALRGKDSWFRPYLALWLAEVSGLEWRQISTRSQTDTTVNADRQTDRQTPRSNSSETDNRFRMALYAYANCPHCGLYCRHCRLSVCVLCHVCESRTLPCLRPTCTRVRSALREDGQQTDVRRTGCRFW